MWGYLLGFLMMWLTRYHSDLGTKLHCLLMTNLKYEEELLVMIEFLKILYEK